MYKLLAVAMPFFCATFVAPARAADICVDVVVYSAIGPVEVFQCIPYGHSVDCLAREELHGLIGVSVKVCFPPPF